MLVAALASLTATPAPAQTPIPTGSIIAPVLHIANREKALHFYVDGLGMQLNMTMGASDRQENILGFSADPRQPGLILLFDTTKPTAPITHGQGYDRLVLRVADLDATAARLKTAGFTPTPIRDVAKGYRMMLATDPDGYRLEMVESRRQP